MRNRTDVEKYLRYAPVRQQKRGAPSAGQFDQFEASTLFCARCQKPVPVRKKLLLALPNGDKYDYLCAYCGNPVGSKTEQVENPVLLVR